MGSNTSTPAKEPDVRKLTDAEIEHLRQEPRPDFSKPLPRGKLPKELQETLNNEESLWTTLYEGKAEESTESSVRYAAYAARFRTILLAAHRYVAYTSDIGESFRPIAHPNMVRAAYGISWAYIAGDVSYEGYKAHIRNEEKTNVPAIESAPAVMAQRAVFQSLASMGLPAFTIHSVVRYSGRALKNATNTTLRTWGPIGLGLAAVPALPYLFDHPVEQATEFVFHKAFELVGGPAAVGHGEPQGKIAAPKEKEKEL